jgi:pimeloyl-ACP methyl ester carboxylesterase
MNPIIIAAIHGILTRQTDPSWPDKLESWLATAQPEALVIKKKYSAGPFPRWNCWVKNPALARSLAAEVAALVESCTDECKLKPDIWFVAHSNGACIALLAARELIELGYCIAGLILTGAACEADLSRNGVLEWLQSGRLGCAIAYSSADDEIVAGDERAATQWIWKLRDAVWGWLIWPYGSLGRTGWLYKGWPVNAIAVDANGIVREATDGPEGGVALTRWFPGGHSAYFRPERIEQTFETISKDLQRMV